MPRDDVPGAVRGRRQLAQVLRGDRRRHRADDPLRPHRRRRADVEDHGFPSPDARRSAEAKKKIGEKIRKGYAPAVMGAAQKRAVTRRGDRQRPLHRQAAAPVLWRFDSGAAARSASSSTRQRCWVGNEDGVDLLARPRRQGARPVQAPRRREVHRRRRRLALRRLRRRQRLRPVRQGPARRLRDRRGRRHLLARHPRRRARRLRRAAAASPSSTTRTRSTGARRASGCAGWMVRCDDARASTTATASGVTIYDWDDGQQLWHQTTARRGPVRLAGGGDRSSPAPARDRSYRLHKRRHAPSATYRVRRAGLLLRRRRRTAGTSSPATTAPPSTASTRPASGCGSSAPAAARRCSMQFHDERLYIVTTDGYAGLHRRQRGGHRGGRGRHRARGGATSRPRSRMPRPQPGQRRDDHRRRRRRGRRVLRGGRPAPRPRASRPATTGTGTCSSRRAPRAGRAATSSTSCASPARGGFYRAHGEIRRLV